MVVLQLPGQVFCIYQVFYTMHSVLQVFHFLDKATHLAVLIYSSFLPNPEKLPFFLTNNAFFFTNLSFKSVFALALTVQDMLWNLKIVNKNDKSKRMLGMLF